MSRRRAFRALGGGGLTFDPASIGNIELWFDSSSDDYINYRTGTDLDSWLDRSGNNRHLVYLTEGSTLCTLTTASGVRSILKQGSTMWTPAFNLTGFPISFFAVYKNLENQTNGALMSYFTHGVANQYLAFRYHNLPGIFYSQRNGGSEFVITTPQINPGSGLHIIEGLSRQDDLYRIAANGGSYSDGTVSQSYNTNMSRFAIGQLRTASNLTLAPTTQEYCEIIMFSKELTSIERSDLVNYFQNKWNL